MKKISLVNNIGSKNPKLLITKMFLEYIFVITINIYYFCTVEDLFWKLENFDRI
jgi:hypothetical protein